MWLKIKEFFIVVGILIFVFFAAIFSGLIWLGNYLIGQVNKICFSYGRKSEDEETFGGGNN